MFAPLKRLFKAPPKPDLGPTGYVGTKVWQGRIMEDYKPELSGRAAVKTYNMMRSEPQVAMTLRAVKLPVLRAKWDVVPSEDDPDRGEEIALAVQKMLFWSGRPGRHHWKSVVRHALLMLDYGFSVLEEVWELREVPELMAGLGLPRKVYWLAGLEPRLPQTIDRWLGLDRPPYALTGIQQVNQHGGSGGPTITAENAVVFTNEREGNNLQGRSLLRSAYKPWYFVDMLEKFDAIGLERSAIGLPEMHFEHLDGLDAEEARRKAEDILAHLNASEQGYIVTMPGQKFDPHNQPYNNDAIRASIRDHKRDIAANALLQFMELGSEGASGSRATASEQRGPFDLSLLALAGDIAETITSETIVDIVRYNYGERPGYPSLVPSGVLDTNMSELATIILNLVSAGALTPDEDLEDWARETAHLPRARREEQLSSPPPRKLSGFWREPTEAERVVAFAEIDRDLQDAKKGFESRVGEVTDEISRELVSQALRYVRTRDLDAVATLKAPLAAKLVSRIKGELKPLVDYGRTSVLEELERSRGILEKRKRGERGYATDELFRDDELSHWQTIKAARRAKAIMDRIEEVTIDEALKLIRAGLSTGAILATVKKAGRLAVALSAGLLIAEAFGMGRGAEIKRQVEVQEEAGTPVVKGIYSALLDASACEVCLALDGQEFAPDDPGFTKYMGGNAGECLGGPRCRCLLFIQTEDMAEPMVKDWQPGDDPSVVMP